MRSVNSKNSFAFEFLFFMKNLQDRFCGAESHMCHPLHPMNSFFLKGVVMRNSKSAQNAPTASLIIAAPEGHLAASAARVCCPR